MKATAVYALTSKGAFLGRSIARGLAGDLFAHQRCSLQDNAEVFESLKGLLQNQFNRYKNHIFITAVGIVVRIIGPLLDSKETDPAVVVLDQEGRYCISLLSGHIGGGNRLAQRVASITGGQPVITTATDTDGLPAIDLLAKEQGLVFGDIKTVKKISGSLLAGEPVQVFDPEKRLVIRKTSACTALFVPLENLSDRQASSPGIVVSWKERSADPNELLLHPRCLIAGVGCNRHTPAHEIIDFIKQVFHENRLCLPSLKFLASIDAKRDEQGLLKAARILGTEILFFQASDLNGVEVPNPSNTVKFYMGVKSVCEAAALLGSTQGQIIVPKTKTGNVTVAVALEP
jgi:cobalt-precorrin 5A hydrolase